MKILTQEEYKEYLHKMRSEGFSMPEINLNFPKLDNWISVKDRLPENDDDVLVFHTFDYHISVGFFEKDQVSFYIESDGSKFYTDCGWNTEIPWAPKGHITHWMPLPQPPND